MKLPLPNSTARHLIAQIAVNLAVAALSRLIGRKAVK